MNLSDYPSDWKEISRHIRFDRAGGQCECFGECGLHKDHPGPRRCIEVHSKHAQWALGKIVLTVAHLCHDTKCSNRDHLRAMCQKCHNRYDTPHRKKNRSHTRAIKLAAGTLQLL